MRPAAQQLAKSTCIRIDLRRLTHRGCSVSLKVQLRAASNVRMNITERATKPGVRHRVHGECMKNSYMNYLESPRQSWKRLDIDMIYISVATVRPSVTSWQSRIV